MLTKNVTVQPCIFVPAYRGQEARCIHLMKIPDKKTLMKTSFKIVKMNYLSESQGRLQARIGCGACMDVWLAIHNNFKGNFVC